MYSNIWIQMVLKSKLLHESKLLTSKLYFVGLSSKRQWISQVRLNLRVRSTICFHNF